MELNCQCLHKTSGIVLKSNTLFALPENAARRFRRNSIESRFNDGSVATNAVFCSLSYRRCVGRTTAGTFKITFLKSASFGGKIEGGGGLDKQSVLPHNPCLKMMFGQAAGAAQMAFCVASAIQIWWTERCCVLK